MNRKICVITGTRADYGLLRCVMEYIEDDTDLKLQIIATGMHLSPEFGLTYKAIEKDGFEIDRKVEMLMSSDTSQGIAKSMGLGMIGFADALSELNPDLVIVLGDRFEIFSAVSVAMVAKIPVAHIHGGETTEGAFDESIRHAITKMSHLHFTATEEYKNRVIQLGEQPNRVFNVGAVGIDNIKNIPLLSREEFEKSINFKLNKKNILITFHPVTLEKSTAQQQFKNILKVLDGKVDTHLIFTKANSDTDGRVINQMIDTYVKNHAYKAIAFKSMGQLRYLSAMKYMDAVVGNSSSGLIEAPSFRIGTINIGDRQRGRVRATSVIDCNNSVEAIQSAFNKLLSLSFQKHLQKVENPYGNGGASIKILKIIRKFSLNGILKKEFYSFKD
jgi:GDP/UDP-N,N'-diacetylbacillosamine 2-epimerase (hydrolysing)